MSFRVCAILFLVMCVSACGSSMSPSSTPEAAPAGSTSITIDSITHTSAANNGLFASPNVAPNSRFNFTFTTAGTFPYHCTIHPNMVGTIIVQ